MAINMMCTNSECKHYFEDNCMKNIIEERIEIDENGVCTTFEKGVNELYNQEECSKPKDRWIAHMTETDCEIWSEDLDGALREDVIADGMKYAKEEGLKSFRIGRVEACGMSTIDVSTILEQAQEQLYDEVGEVSESYLSETTNQQEKELEDRLNEVFYEWHKKYKLFPTCYKVMDDEVIEVK